MRRGAFRGLSSSSESDEGGFLRTKRRRTDANERAADERAADERAADDFAGAGAGGGALFDDAARLAAAAEFDDLDLPSDVEAALGLLRPSSAPFVVLQHELYSVVQNRSTVDRDLRKLAQAGAVRLLQLSSSGNDVGVVRGSDWEAAVAAISHAVAAVGASAASQPPSPGDWFARLAREHRTSLYVTLADIQAHAPHLTDADRGGNVTLRPQDDAAISAWTSAGLLRRRQTSSGEAGAFWFAYPGVGELSRHIVRGRQALLAALKRARYKQLNVDFSCSGDLGGGDNGSGGGFGFGGGFGRGGARASKAAAPWDAALRRASPRGLEFHIRDLVGSGLARLDSTPAGRFLRLLDA